MTEITFFIPTFKVIEEIDVVDIKTFIIIKQNLEKFAAPRIKVINVFVLFNIARAHLKSCFII